MMTLVCGMPNSGKTAYSERFENVIHFDDYLGGRYREGYKVASETDEVCVEGLFQRRKTRMELLEACGHERNVCIFLDTPAEVCMQREMFKGHTYMEPPTYDEGWDEIIVLRGGGDDEGSCH